MSHWQRSGRDGSSQPTGRPRRWYALRRGCGGGWCYRLPSFPPVSLVRCPADAPKCPMRAVCGWGDRLYVRAANLCKDGSRDTCSPTLLGFHLRSRAQSRINPSVWVSRRSCGADCFHGRRAELQDLHGRSSACPCACCRRRLRSGVRVALPRWAARTQGGPWLPLRPDQTNRGGDW